MSHSNKYSDAIAIAMVGACNPTGITHSFNEHVKRMRDEENADTNTIRNDPALRLMAYQFAYLMGVDYLSHKDFHDLLKICKEKVNEAT